VRTLYSNDDLFSLQFSKESQFRCLPSKMPACTVRVTSADLSTLRVLDIQHLAVEDLPFCTDNYRQTAKLHQCSNRHFLPEHGAEPWPGRFHSLRG
jgi:hypothetical protein